MRAKRIFFGRHARWFQSGNDVNINIAAFVDQLIHKRTAQQLHPARPHGLARHNFGDIIFAGEIHDRMGQSIRDHYWKGAQPYVHQVPLQDAMSLWPYRAFVVVK